MNKLNKKEEEIKDILGGLELDINTNDIWANIESDLPQPKKKRKLGIFLLFGMIGLALVGLVLNLNTLKNTERNTKDIDTSPFIQSENKIAISENENVKSQVATIVNTENNQEKISNITLPIEQKKKTQAKSKKINLATIDPISRIDINTSLFTNTGIENSSIVESNNIAKSIAEPIITNLININNDTKTELLVARNYLSVINPSPTLSSRLLEIAQRQRIESSPSKVTPIHNTGRQLILQVKLGANQNRTSISNINGGGEFDASEFNFERDRIGFSGTFNIGVENNGWRLLAGVSYHHHVSTYERDDVVIVVDQKTGVESFRISDNGTTTAQNGSVSVTSVRDNAISFHRQHRAIDFHASIGKRLWSYKGLKLMADAGIGINTLTNTSGYFLEDSSFGFTKIDNDTHPYKINTHWNAIASLELAYDFGNTRIGLSPFIRYNPNSITSQKHFYTLKNSQVGMQLSLTITPTRE